MSSKNLNTNGNEAVSPISSEKTKIVLAGNPNVGKSVFFNHFSGLYVDVSNFPGTTVSVSKAEYGKYEIFDTPGIYGVSSFNDEEKVARDIILSADIVLNVINALYLERDLFLTLQLIDMGKKVSVFLNFSDELEKRNIKIDAQKLSDLLGVEVIETSAVNKKGFDKIDFAIENARHGLKDDNIPAKVAKLTSKNISESEAILILEGDTEIAKKNNFEEEIHEKENIYLERRARVNIIYSEVEYEDTPRGHFLNKLGQISLNPVTGLPILAVLLYLVYLFIGDFVAQRVVDFTENTIGVGIFEYYTKSTAAEYFASDLTVEILDVNEEPIDTKTFNFPEGMNANPELKEQFYSFSDSPGAAIDFQFRGFFTALLFGEFGVVTMSVTYLLFLLLPLVLSFYFVMALLEDSGYLPRLATMLDKVFNQVGLNGRAVIPIMLGFGCITMANVTTRILGTEREKSIVTAILQFVIPCSAQLAVIAALMTGAGFGPFIIYLTTIFSVLILLSTILNKTLPGESSPLLLNLPTMQIPRLMNIVKKTYYRSLGFYKEAWIWFVIGAFGIGLMQLTGMLQVWQDMLAPITTNWLKLPSEASSAFIMGIVRRDFGAAGLFYMDLTPMQITVALTTITLFVPCIASVMVMIKERGIKESMIIWLGTWITAFFTGGVIAQIFIN